MMEIAKVRKTRHATYNINYHLIWIPKTRMKVLTKPFDGVVKDTIRRICAWHGWTPMALQVMPDHMHFFVSAPPKWAPSQVVHGTELHWKDPVRYTFAYGGKDGIPYPVDRKTYDRSTGILRNALDSPKISREEKMRALRRRQHAARAGSGCRPTGTSG